MSKMMFRRCKACNKQFDTPIFGNQKYCSAQCREGANTGVVLIEGTFRSYKFTSLRGSSVTSLEQIVKQHENSGAVLRVQFNRSPRSKVKSHPKKPKTNCLCCGKPLTVVNGHQRSFYCSMLCKTSNRYTWIPFLLAASAKGHTAYWCAAQIGVSSKLVYTWATDINAALAGSGKQLNFNTK